MLHRMPTGSDGADSCTGLMPAYGELRDQGEAASWPVAVQKHSFMATCRRACGIHDGRDGSDLGIPDRSVRKAKIRPVREGQPITGLLQLRALRPVRTLADLQE